MASPRFELHSVAGLTVHSNAERVGTALEILRQVDPDLVDANFSCRQASELDLNRALIDPCLSKSKDLLARLHPAGQARAAGWADCSQARAEHHEMSSRLWQPGSIPV